MGRLSPFRTGPSTRNGWWGVGRRKDLSPCRPEVLTGNSDTRTGSGLHHRLLSRSSGRGSSTYRSPEGPEGSPGPFPGVLAPCPHGGIDSTQIEGPHFNRHQPFILEGKWRLDVWVMSYTSTFSFTVLLKPKYFRWVLSLFIRSIFGSQKQ